MKCVYWYRFCGCLCIQSIGVVEAWPLVGMLAELAEYNLYCCIEVIKIVLEAFEFI